MASHVIDCHTHVYPPEVSADPRKWAADQKENHWSLLVAPENRPSIQDWSSPHRMLGEMDAAGVDQAILLGWYWEHEHSCRWHNTAIADWVRQAPDRFIGFAAIHPAANVREQLEIAASLGLQGIGELHHGVQHFNAKSEGWLEIADWCVANKWQVNFHVTGTIGRQHPNAVATPLEELLAFAKSAPEVPLIFAHWGGDLLLQEYQSTSTEIPPNIYFDCSASPLLHSAEIFKQAIDRIGIDRVLFGSDYPLRLFPKRQKHADFYSYLEYVRNEAALDRAELKALLGENAKRLFNRG